MSFAIAAVIKTTLLLIGAGLAAGLLKRASSSIRYAIWTISLLCGLVLPLADAGMPSVAQIHLPLLKADTSDILVVRNFVPNASVQPLLGQPSEEPIQRARSSATTSLWVALVWALGFFYCAGRVAISMASARRLVKKSTPLRDSRWNSLLQDLRSEFSVSQSVELRNGGTVPPLTLGLFRHFILLPSDAESWTAAERRAVIAHELAHARRRDGLLQFMAQIVCCIYWFNPMVWLAAGRMRLERERACDDYALNAGVNADMYADHLLELASGRHRNESLATMSIAHPSQLETRLRAILNPRIRRSRLPGWAAGLLLMSLATATLSIASMHVTPILSLSLPTTFSLLAVPLLPRPQAATAATTGTVTGRVEWADGPPLAGAMVSAIATSTEGLPPSWVMGTRVAGSAVADASGRYRIENLQAGLYHIVTGPVYLPRTFSDVSMVGNVHLVSVPAGKTASNLNFSCVRNAEGVIYDSSRLLTITGKIVFTSFGGPKDPNILVTNDDGSVSHWQFRDPNPNSYPRYWWPGFDAAPGGPLDKMAKAGETVTITGTDSGYGGPNGRWPGLHILIVQEVTRGGVPGR